VAVVAASVVVGQPGSEDGDVGPGGDGSGETTVHHHTAGADGGRLADIDLNVIGKRIGGRDDNVVRAGGGPRTTSIQAKPYWSVLQITCAVELAGVQAGSPATLPRVRALLETENVTGELVTGTPLGSTNWTNVGP